MQIKEITDKNIWEGFFLGQKNKSFLQSWNWGELQTDLKNKIWRLGLFDNKGILIGISFVVKLQARRGVFLMVQHGPLGENLSPLLEEIKRIAKKEKVDFVRIAPLLEDNEKNRQMFNDSGFIEAPMHTNAYKATWRLNLDPSEDELLKNMRKTTRYLIRQTQKNEDIRIEKSDNIADIKLYEKLQKAVAKRQNFVSAPEVFIEKEFEVFQKENKALLFFGKYKNETVAGSLIIFWQGIGFYHLAGSLSKYAKLSIPYLLQWEAIKEAKKRGCEFYDFWGFTDPKKYPKHPWAGPTLFKMGFGGKAYKYMKTQDLPVSKKYYLIYLFEKLRKLKRGL